MTDATLAGTDLSDAVPEALITRVRRELLGSIRDRFEEIPGRQGSWRFGEEAGDRTLTLELNLVGAADDYPVEVPALEARRAAVRALAEWVDLEGFQALVIDDEPDRYWMARIAKSSSVDEWLTAADLELDFRTGPFAYALELSTHTWSSSDAVAEVFVIPDTVNAFPVLELTIDDATVDPAGLTIIVNGLELSIGDALADTDVRTVSSLTYTVTSAPNADTELTGLIDLDNLAMSNVDGDFPILVPDTNSVAIEGADTNAVLTWRRRYR